MSMLSIFACKFSNPCKCRSFRITWAISDPELFIQEMVSFSALGVLEANELHTSTMCQLTQLKELHLELTSNDINLGAMASNLNNFERLRIVGTVDQLSSFLRHSKKLKFVIF